jgi:leucyl/phenylalanyl-tRNA--protein transferase
LSASSIFDLQFEYLSTNHQIRLNIENRRLKMSIPWLGTRDPFPPVEQALIEPNGLLAAGGDLSPERLVDAYARGIFPWFNDEDPVLWWSPDPRMVLFPRELHVSRSLRRAIRTARFSVTLDRAFDAVVDGCAAPRRNQDGTWITGEMMRAYSRLAQLGLAHSVETWEGTDLVGGLYGVALGRVFYGESMFSRRSDASKVALAHLVRQLERWNFVVIDCQMATEHLASFGAREIPRADFLRDVRAATVQPGIPAPWRIDADLMTGL